MYFGAVSKSENTEGSYFSLCNLCSIAPYACQEEKLMIRLGGEGSPQPATHLLPLSPAANAGPATLHPSTPKEVTRQCFQSNTSSSVFRSVAHNPKRKLKTEVKPVLCKGKRLTGLPFTWQNPAP